MSSLNKEKAVTPYSMFQTNKQIEAEGVELDYGTFYLKVGRAGGANKMYRRVLERILKPHRRAIQTDTIQEKKLTELLIRAQAEGNVYGWGYKRSQDDKKFIDGKMLDEDGNEMDFSVDNVIKLFTDLPDLFADVQDQTGKAALFREFVNEEDAKN